MKIDWTQAGKNLTGNSAVFTYCATIVVTFLTWLYTTVQTDADLKAKDKYQQKHEDDITEIITLRATNCCDTVR